MIQGTAGTCVKTGAEVYLEEYGTWFRGDAHRVGAVMIFRLNPLSESREAPGRVHYRVSKIAAAWPSRPQGTSQDWTVAVEERHAIYYGSNGRVPVKLVGGSDT